MAADARILAPTDVVGRDLPEEIDGQRAVDADEAAQPAMERRLVDGRHRQDAHDVVAVEPPVERLAAEGEGADADTVVEPLAVGHLARLMERHDAVGDHLRVDAEVAARPRREQAGDLVRNRADAELERRAVGDEAGDGAGNRQVLGRRLRRGQSNDVRLVLDPGVDGAQVDAVVAELRQSAEARQAWIHLRDGEAIGIGGGLAERDGARARGDAEGDEAVGIGRAGDRQHDAGLHPERKALEPMEVGWEILDRPVERARGALHGAEEAAHDANPRVLEERVGSHQQPRVEHDVFEVLACAEGFEEPARLARGEAAQDLITGSDERGSVLEVEAVSDGRHMDHTLRESIATVQERLCRG